MTLNARICLSKGARCSCVAQALVNPKPGRRIDDLIAISRDVTTCGGKNFVSIFFQSSMIPGLLHAAKRWVRVEEHGPKNQVWDNVPATEALATAVAINKQGKEITDFVFHAQNWAEDIALVQDMEFEVDSCHQRSQQLATRNPIH